MTSLQEQYEQEGIFGAVKHFFSPIKNLFPQLKTFFSSPEKIKTSLIITTIVIVGAIFRLQDVNWDSNQHLHPDERAITMAVSRLGMPRSVGEFFDAEQSPLNPHFFAYGSFPFYFVRGTAFIISVVTHNDWIIGYDGITLYGRVISALFDLGTLLVLFGIGLKLFNKRTGLIAAGLLAITVFHIQLSHFYAVDGILTFFIALSFFFLIDVAEKPSWKSFILTGISFGIALACKVSAIAFMAPFLIASLFGVYRYFGQTKDEEPENKQKRFAFFAAPLTALLIALLCMFIAMPYAFIDNAKNSRNSTRIQIGPITFSTEFSRNVSEQNNMVTGEGDLPYTRQYAFTPKFIYQLKNIVFFGMGIPLGVLGILGILFLMYECIKNRFQKHLLLLSWTIPYFLVNARFQVKFMRYMLPIYPFLILAGAYLLALAIEKSSNKIRSRFTLPYLSGVILTGLIFISTLGYAIAFSNIYGQQHSRILASEWMFENIPKGKTIAVEHWDDSLPISVSPSMNVNSYNYTQITFNGYEADNESKLEHIITTLSKADYFTMSSNRLWASIPKLPLRYPLTTNFYKLLFEEKLGYTLVNKTTVYPRIFNFDYNDDNADESFTVYDHPQVLIYQKTADFSPASVRALLENYPEPIENTPLQAQSKTVVLGTKQNEANAQADNREFFVLEGLSAMEITVGPLHIPVAFFVWWISLLVIGILFFPICTVLFNNFEDSGYAFAKTVGLLFSSWVLWLFANAQILQFTRTNVVITILLSGVITAGFAHLISRGKKQSLLKEIITILKTKWKTLLGLEILFSIALTAFTTIRMLNPDIWQPWLGGEKLFEQAFLAGVTKSAYFPPMDPWFTGGTINYYYYGLYIVSFLAKLNGLALRVVFTLATPTIFALTIISVFSLVYTLILRSNTKTEPVPIPESE
ncbi:MAG: DUF2298 domain-containing protein [bacterium]